jgi:sec-independent protein translocase protein TatB
MFDLAWSEIALIGVVALIAIGPKDMPVAIKAVAQMVKKARRMAAEFQTHVDEMVREANLHEVRDQINEIRSMDIKGKILNAVDDDGSIRRTMADRPFNPSPPPVTPVVHDAPAETVVQPHAEHVIAAPDTALAFVPPGDAAAMPDLHAEPPPMIPPAYSDPRAAPPVQHEVQREAQHEPAAHPAPHA